MLLRKRVSEGQHRRLATSYVVVFISSHAAMFIEIAVRGRHDTDQNSVALRMRPSCKEVVNHGGLQDLICRSSCQSAQGADYPGVSLARSSWTCSTTRSLLTIVRSKLILCHKAVSIVTAHHKALTRVELWFRVSMRIIPKRGGRKAACREALLLWRAGRTGPRWSSAERGKSTR